MKKNVSGFTIVELLIVIVIIAVLAAISIVAYKGVQQRAANTSRIASVRQYIKLLSAYAVQNNGTYPSFTEGACFGTGYTNGECSNAGLSTTWPATTTEQPAFNSALSSVGTIPNYLKLNSSATSSGNEVGAFIYNRGTTNETPSRSYRLVYFLQGSNQDCGIERVLRATDGSTAIGTGAWGAGISTGPRNSNYGSGTTYCFISLLNPNEF